MPTEGFFGYQTAFHGKAHLRELRSLHRGIHLGQRLQIDGAQHHCHFCFFWSSDIIRVFPTEDYSGPDLLGESMAEV